MAFDFPANPVQGEIFTDTPSGSTYMWSGYAWGRKYSEPPAGIAHPPAETIPVEPPIDGATTVDAALRNLSVEVDQLAADQGNKVDVAGDTMTGPLILSEHPVAASPALQAATKQYVDQIGAGLPLGGNPGEALVLDTTGAPAWGAPINGDIYVTTSFVVTGLPGTGQNYLPRWAMNLGDGEDADFTVQRFNDGGGKMGHVIRGSRQTGVVDFGKMPTVNGKSLLDHIAAYLMQHVRK